MNLTLPTIIAQNVPTLLNVVIPGVSDAIFKAQTGYTPAELQAVIGRMPELYRSFDAQADAAKGVQEREATAKDVPPLVLLAAARLMKQSGDFFNWARSADARIAEALDQAAAGGKLPRDWRARVGSGQGLGFFPLIGVALPAFSAIIGWGIAFAGAIALINSGSIKNLGNAVVAWIAAYRQSEDDRRTLREWNAQRMAAGQEPVLVSSGTATVSDKLGAGAVGAGLGVLIGIGALLFIGPKLFGGGRRRG